MVDYNMSRKIIFILFVLAFYISVNEVYACSIDPTPRFYIKANNLKDCHFTSYNENISSDINVIEFIKNRIPSYANCNNLFLFENEQEIFSNVINQFNKQYYGFASINIEKQSNEDYDIFKMKLLK